MALVRFTKNLKRFFPTLCELNVPARSVAEVITAVEQKFPGISSYIIDETGALRKHVNIFVGDEMIDDRARLSDCVEPDDTVYIAQALSGG